MHDFVKGNFIKFYEDLLKRSVGVQMEAHTADALEIFGQSKVTPQTFKFRKQHKHIREGGGS